LEDYFPIHILAFFMVQQNQVEVVEVKLESLNRIMKAPKAYRFGVRFPEESKQSA
jgi:hypothetical protein